VNFRVADIKSAGSKIRRANQKLGRRVAPVLLGLSAAAVLAPQFEVALDLVGRLLADAAA
jgi:hypothetical protein